MIARLLKLLRLRQQREQRAKSLMDLRLREVGDARREHAEHKNKQEKGRKRLGELVREFAALTNKGLVSSEQIVQFQAERRFAEKEDLLGETRIIDAEYKLFEAKILVTQAREGYLAARRRRERIELLCKRKQEEAAAIADARLEEEAVEMWRSPATQEQGTSR